MTEQAEQGFNDIFKRAVAEAQGFVKDSFESTTQGRDIWLRDGMPRSVTGQAAQAINRRQCEVWGKDPSAFRPAWSDQLSGICTPYLESRGLTSPQGSAESPIVGGQCAGVEYIFRYAYTASTVQCNGLFPRTFTSGGTVQVTGVYGPVSRRSIARNGCATGEISAGGDEVLCFFEDGSPRVVSAGAGVSGEDFTSFTYTVFSFERVDGLQECPDPPAQYSPGVPYSQPLPPPPRLFPGNPFSPGFEVNINPDGSISVTSGDNNFTLEPGPDGEIPPVDDGGGDGGGGTPAPAPGDQGQAGQASDAEQGMDAEGEADEGQVLVGLKLDLLNQPPDRYRLAPGIFRGGAYVYMGGPSGLDQDFAGSVLTDGQFIFAEKENLTTWRVRANVGFNWRVTPYYREVP